jgi:restriction system protein
VGAGTPPPLQGRGTWTHSRWESGRRAYGAVVADVSIPTYVEMMLPTLQALDTLGGSGTRDEIDDAVITRMGFTDEQMAVEFPPTATQKGSKVIHRLAWARTYPKKAGTIDNSRRAVWTIEPQGRAYLEMATGEAAAALRVADSEIRRQARLAKVAATESVQDEQVSGEMDADTAPPELDDVYEWTDRLIARMLDLSPAAFERLAQRLLREAGFKNVEVTGRSGDGGIDGIGVYRPSLIGFPIFFQCKRFKDSVGPGMVRDFRGAMSGRGEKGLLITTGTFTAEAKREASRDGAPPVELIDGQDLCRLLKEFNVGVTTRLLEAVDIDEAFFADL